MKKKFYWVFTKKNVYACIYIYTDRLGINIQNDFINNSQNLEISQVLSIVEWLSKFWCITSMRTTQQ